MLTRNATKRLAESKTKKSHLTGSGFL